MNTHRPTHSTEVALANPGRRVPTLTDPSVHIGQILRPARPGAAGWIRHTQYMHLPDRQLTLDGPFSEVRQIVALLMARGELAHASHPTPTAQGVIVTVQYAAVAVRAGAARGRQVRRRWTARRIAITTGTSAAVTGLLVWAGWLAVAWVLAHPLAILAVLALLSLGLTTAGQRVCKTAVTVIHRH